MNLFVMENDRRGKKYVLAETWSDAVNLWGAAFSEEEEEKSPTIRLFALEHEVLYPEDMEKEEEISKMRNDMNRGTRPQ